jgi:thiosulfate reductase/polysulfide reductase chain A
MASRFGVKNGQKIILENHDGAKSLPIAIRATEAIRRDCAYMVHGFGTQACGLTKAYRKGASDTQLMTRIAVDPIMGGTGMRVNFVRVLPHNRERS